MIKIIQCNDPLRWYADKVGELVPFEGDTGTEYQSRESAGYINFVQYEDAEIVKVEQQTKMPSIAGAREELSKGLS